jgi:hypothetical protein
MDAQGFRYARGLLRCSQIRLLKQSSKLVLFISLFSYELGAVA